MFVLLVENRITEEILEFFEQWRINTAGSHVEKTLLQLAMFYNSFSMCQLVLAIFLSALRVICSEDLWIHFFFQNGSYIQTISFFLVKFLQFFGGVSIISHCDQMLYGAAHYRFQFIIFNAFTESLTKEWDFVKDNELLNNSDYQKEINFRLKLQITRHVQFLM